MKKLIVVLLIASVVAPSVFADEKEKLDPANSELKGRMDAIMFHKATGWGALGFTGSFIPGFFFGVFVGAAGGGAAVGIAALSNPNPKSMPDEDEVDLDWYVEGYRRRAKLKNVGRASLGAGMGIVSAVVAIYVFVMALYY